MKSSTSAEESGTINSIIIHAIITTIMDRSCAIKVAPAAATDAQAIQCVRVSKKRCVGRQLHSRQQQAHVRATARRIMQATVRRLFAQDEGRRRGAVIREGLLMGVFGGAAFGKGKDEAF